MDQPTEKYFQRNANWMLWIAAATLVFINLLLPLILPNDASIGQISSFQRNGFLTLDTLETRKDALKPGDRVIKIDNCAVNDWIQFQCDRPKNLSTERVKFEISRDQRLITLYLPLERASIRSLFTHAPAELICSLLFLGISALIFFFKKDSAPANLLSKAFLLLGIYASSSAVGIQPSLMLYPLLFWFKLFSNGFAYIFLYAIAVELSLTYPKSIFSKTYLTKLLRWVIYLLVPLMALLILRFPDNPNTGLQNMLEFSQTITAAETLWLLIAYGYQLFTSARPSTRLSLRWINFGGVISICLLIIVYVSLANTGTIPPGYRPFGTQALSLNDPFLLLFLLIPLCFPVFIPSQYQLNIDLIIRQSLFYLTTLLMLGLAYMLLLSLSLPVAKHFLFLNNPIIMGLTLACGTFILHTPISQQINAFIDHIFYPSKRLYEKTLPKILIRLSENLDITELNQLLLEEIPEKLHLLGSSLLLVDEKTNLYFFTHTDNPNLGISVRHPYIAHLIRVRKILLRFFDAPNLHMGVGAFMRKYRIEVSIPLFHQDRLLGVYNLEAKKDHAPFTILDIQQLEKLKPWVETAIHNAFEITSMDTYSQRLEETVKQRSEELDRVVDQTEKTRSAAERASDVRNVFLGSVSHNIRTPMNTIIGAANLLLNTQLDQSQFEHVETIRQSSNDMISIINDILDYAVIETGHLALQRNTFEIDRIIQAVFNSVGPQAAEKKIEMIYQLEAHTPITIISDSARLRQILYNLVHNAVKYTDQGSVIVTVTAQPTKPDPLPDHLQHPERVFALTFTVRDTGQGIAPEDMPTLFAPHQNQESGGLGLAVSHRLCQILGGDITAQSEGPGKGATFTFSVLVETALDTYPAYLGVDQSILKGKQVLVFECDEQRQKLLELQCQSWGMKITTHDQPEQFLDELRTNAEIDLIMLDGDCAELSRISAAVAGKPKERAAKKALLILMHSQNTPKEQLKKFKRRITKPIDAAQLYNLFTQAFIFEKNERTFYPAKSSPVPILDHEMGDHFPLQILLAEDNALDQKLIRLQLEMLGYRPDLVSNGQEALEAIRERPYDVILIDMQMPIMSGYEAVKSIRALADQVQQPYVIAMTANVITYNEQACSEAGANAFLLKPFEAQRLSRLLKKANPHVIADRPTMRVADLGQIIEPAPPPDTAAGTEESESLDNA